MLVLTRKSTETIHIGKDVRITVLDIHGERVRLGITAPDGVCILRQELIVRGKGRPRLQTRPSLSE